VTSVWSSAFFGCAALNIVTFTGDRVTLLSNSFPGNLYSRYNGINGGRGTYTTTNPGDNAVWIKDI
jgi:hypothetical protein